MVLANNAKSHTNTLRVSRALGDKEMSAGVAQANKFYEEVAATQIVWFGCLPNEILLEFDVSDNKVSLPLWSSKSRIERLKKTES